MAGRAIYILGLSPSDGPIVWGGEHGMSGNFLFFKCVGKNCTDLYHGDNAASTYWSSLIPKPA
eukprot:scaffold840_cov344-Pavlova_lutheri.AAC.106